MEIEDKKMEIEEIEAATNLQELTGRESGVVIYPEQRSAIVCNWSDLNGLPRLFGPMLVGLPGGAIEAEETDRTDDAGAYLDDIEIVYDIEGDEEMLRKIKTPATVYTLTDGTIIIVPDDWF